MADLDRREFLKLTTAIGLSGGTLLAMKRKTSPARRAPRKPNVVFVLTDQWRAQATGYAGDPNVKTPNLDSLASQSINFENAVSVCPVCTPYRAALLTGRYPLSTGIFMNDLYLPSDELCMAEIFKEAGYDTGYIGKWHLDGHGRETFIPKERRQGFDYWKALECTHDYNKSHYYAGDDETKLAWPGYDAYAQTKDAQKYILDHAANQKPFLLMVAYGGPHFPHETAPEDLKAQYPVSTIQLRPNVPETMKEKARKEAQGYYGHCSALDRCVGELQKTLVEAGLVEDTIFIFTSDHGEMLGSQGQRPWIKQVPWDESVCVPFLLRYPAISGSKGRKVRTPINAPDILPTLLSLSGIELPSSIEGEDLSDFVKTEIPDEDRAALVMSPVPFGGNLRGKAYRGIRTKDYSYIKSRNGPWLLFDNNNDPYQMKNLVGSSDHLALQKQLEGRLRAELQKTGDTFSPPQEYLDEWGFTMDPEYGAIAYGGPNQRVQSPLRRGPKKKER